MARHEAIIFDGLMTPAKWAERLGIKGLVAEEWQECDSDYDYKAKGYRNSSPPYWEMEMDHSKFVGLLHSEWNAPRDPNSPRVLHRKGKRTAKLPTFSPTREQVLDILGVATGWLPTTEITWRIASPLGIWSRYSPRFPANTKVTAILKALVEEGLVVQQDPSNREVHTRRIFNEVAPEGNSSLWATLERLESWVEDRRLDEVEQARRWVKLEGFMEGFGEYEISHPSQPIFFDGKPDPDADAASVKIPWGVMEHIIDEYVNLSMEMVRP